MEKSSIVMSVECNNSDEYRQVQEKFFMMGYRWPSRNDHIDEMDKYPTYIDAWSDKEITWSAEYGHEELLGRYGVTLQNASEFSKALNTTSNE